MFRCRSQRGQSMVEFALVSPLLFLMLFGILEGGWLLFHNHQIANAAREGARYAVVHGTRSDEPATTADVRDQAIEQVYLSNPNSLEVELELLDGNLEPESRIRVDVDYVHQTLTGFVFQSASIDLSAESTMMIHY